jgi:N-acetylglutamate synthase-like GNAT family acetyltransferase
MNLSIHIATAADLGAINARYAAIGFRLSQPHDLNVLATVDGEIAGQGRIVPVDERSGELGGIHVLPEYAGRGFAREIVDYLIRQTPLPHLYCLPFGDLAGFYGSVGFMPVADHATVPLVMLQKFEWCKTSYDKPVLLLERAAA